MAVGYHSRAFHGSKDPTSTPTSKRMPLEVLAAHDKGGGQNTLKGMPRPQTLLRKTLANKGERP